MTTARTLVIALGIVICASFAMSRAVAFTTRAADYDQLKTEAERFYSEHSYSKAHELYEQAKDLQLPADQKRWVDFRIADTSWRAQAGTQTSDSTVFDRALEQLQTSVSAIKREEDRDLVWALANESLGDFYWQRRESQNWSEGWKYYQLALDWWAGSSDFDVARDRYLAIVWKMAEPGWMNRDYGYYYWTVPAEILDNAIKIAVNPNDKARAHYLIAMTLRSRGGEWRDQLRIPDEFEAALAAGKAVDWYDDALFAYAQWLVNNGRAVLLDNGQWTRKQDFVAGLELFQRLVREFQIGESRYYDAAIQAIKSITDPNVSVSVSNIFLPGSEIQYNLNWRNVKQIDLALHKVQLVRDLNFSHPDNGATSWQDQINLAAAEKIRSWTKDTEDKGDYQPGQSQERLDPTLESGAYVLTASAGGQTSRTIILVSDAAVVLKVIGDQALTFTCDAMNSSPIANAKVRVWRFAYLDNRWTVADSTKQSDENGLCHFARKDFANVDSGSVQFFAAIEHENRQAFAMSGSNGYPGPNDNWRIYAFTDRAAYRPDETVQWKFIARAPSANGFTTPANQAIWYDINDPRGSKVSDGKAELNAFGSAWGSLALSQSMPLGEYQITFYRDSNHNGYIGSAALFRLEEYKLPEFKVAISTPEENGKRRSFVLGETVDLTIQSDYYFGGPVANATVEVIVHQSPYYRWWAPSREYPWLYEDSNPYRYWGGGDTIVKRDTLKTDATGKATLSIDTPANEQQDLQYRIEAHVTDASRREITANESVRVTRQRYYVYPRAEHNIYHPNDKVQVHFKAMDANDQPVPVEGQVKVTREEWIEIWVNPQGEEVTGDALRQIQEKSRIFPPPPPNPIGPPWQLKFRGYKSEDVLTTTVKLDAKGEAEFYFTPSTTGYYKVAWFSKDTSPLGIVPITAETSIWVANSDTTMLGYRSGGVEIILDKDTIRVDQSVPVMISTPTNDRYVLFSVEGNDLYSYQVIHVTGNVKLTQVPIQERHIPNVYLSAVTANAGQLYQDQKEITVPPVQQYLNIDVASDREQYQPGEDGTFTIKTTDHGGKPVTAEVALSVVDESVTYIQQDYAGDPRAYFFDRKQGQYVRTGSTFQQNSYVKLIKGDKDQLLDERLSANVRRDNLDDNGNRIRQVDGAIDLAWQRSASLEARMEYAAAPPPVPPPAGDTAMGMPMMSKAARGAGSGGAAFGGAPVEEPAVVVRSDFRSTLMWQPAVVTDESGIATVKVKYADSLTTWTATARASTTGLQFGIGNASTRTKMPLIARLQAPRFFLVGDTVTVSGVINNNTDEVQTVTPQLDAEGLTIIAMLRNGEPTKGLGVIDIPANGEARVDWRISVDSPGTAKLTLTAKSKMYADGMEKTYAIYEHGVEKFLASSGKVRGNDITVHLNIPSKRKADSTSLMVQVTPSMAVTMLDALPYLIDYPYGCTEQTMSRFLPTAITAKTLRDLGIKPETVMGKLFGGIEAEHADQTHNNGKKDLKQLDQITQASLDRLYDFQHGDGGWGWWKEGDSDHYMTAYVLWGLSLARDAGMDVKGDVMSRAYDYLSKELVEEENAYDMQAWILHALAAYKASAKDRQPSEFERKAIENLWTNRDRLNAYTRALFALATSNFGDDAKAKILVENLRNGVKRDDRPDASVIVKGVEGPNQAVIGTAHWGEDGIYWRWSDGGVEATAFALKAMLAIDPKNELIEPVTNWLIKNRRGAQWNSTKDTAITVLALNDYLRVSGELSPELEYELFVNGKSIAMKKLTAKDALGSPSRFAIDRDLIRDGDNEIRIVRKSGNGPVYFSVESKFFSLEEPVQPAGNEIFVRREYYKLVPRPTLLKGYVYDRQPLMDGGTVASGERVEVVMTIEAKNNYEYLVFEDLKPAGLEAVAVRSGEPIYTREMKSGAVEHTFGDGKKSTEAVMSEQAHGDAADYTGRSRWVYQELRDRKVAMFIDKLPEGVWELRYDLRAETPGRFHALPVMGYAMYVPEIRCNSAELRVTVIEADQNDR